MFQYMNNLAINKPLCRNKTRFKEKYAWIIVQVEKTSNELQSILDNIRLRMLTTNHHKTKVLQVIDQNNPLQKSSSSTTNFKKMTINKSKIQHIHFQHNFKSIPSTIVNTMTSKKIHEHKKKNKK